MACGMLELENRMFNRGENELGGIIQKLEK